MTDATWYYEAHLEWGPVLNAFDPHVWPLNVATAHCATSTTNPNPPTSNKPGAARAVAGLRAVEKET